MSISCGVECVFILGCSRWAWKRCTYIGADDSSEWPLATSDEFEPVPRICRVILAVYEPDLKNPKFPPPGGYRLDPDSVVKQVTYEQTQGNSPPYIIYCDNQNQEIVLAIRGLNLAKESDYKVLLDNGLGMQKFDGGYVHHGLLKSAIWLLNQESETLMRLWVEKGRCYKMIFAGHSLGSGVASLLTVIVVNHRDRLGGISRGLIRCYAVAPARCMSLNLAVKYADVIHSIVLQDDFLPRTPTPLEDIFKSIFWDTFIPEHRKLRDPRRLYAPGRIYHVVERKFCRCGRFPPEVRTAIPVEGRFEHIVLSCNATSDHAIIWIAREAEKALERMESDSETVTTAPKIQKLERLQTIEKEHKDALDRAVSLNIPDAVSAVEDESSRDGSTEPSQNEIECASRANSKGSSDGRTNWDKVVEKLFDERTGQLLLKKDQAE
ncbi:Fungal lipase-like domain [Dillenia turbinata]|uniref:Fungal lipase-like domain n=1 Tax=Dillenia turbinata TaxID=194707 RepID=A0AAN8VI61_9MAGN